MSHIRVTLHLFLYSILNDNTSPDTPRMAPPNNMFMNPVATGINIFNNLCRKFLMWELLRHLWRSCRGREKNKEREQWRYHSFILPPLNPHSASLSISPSPRSQYLTIQLMRIPDNQSPYFYFPSLRFFIGFQIPYGNEFLVFTVVCQRCFQETQCWKYGRDSTLCSPTEFLTMEKQNNRSTFDEILLRGTFLAVQKKTKIRRNSKLRFSKWKRDYSKCFNFSQRFQSRISVNWIHLGLNWIVFTLQNSFVVDTVRELINWSDKRIVQ